MRLIDADALKQSVEECDVCNVCPERKARCNYDCEFPDHLTPKFEALIDAQPTIEPKRGEWIDMGDFEQCSVCKGTHLKEFQSYYGKTTWIKTPYCPNCGADMREREGE